MSAAVRYVLDPRLPARCPPRRADVRRAAAAAAGLALLLASAGCSRLPFFGDKDAADSPATVPTIPITVNGVDEDIADTVRAHLALNGKPCTIAPAYFESIVSQADREAAMALQAWGYYAPAVEVESRYDAECPAVDINVTPGEVVRLDRISIDVRGDAAEDPRFARAVAALPLTSGDPLHHGTYASARSSLEALASEFGYLDAAYSTARLAVIPESLTANIDWVFDSGPRYRFGPLQVSQEPALLRPGLIDRLLEYEEAQPYSVDEVARLNRALSQSGYFGRVDVRPDFEAAAKQAIPLDITVTPRNQHNLTSGIGVSTDETLRGRVAYTNRRLNRRGHRFSVGARASFIEQRVSGDYQIPLRHPQDEWLTFQAGVRRQTVDAFDTTDLQLSVLQTRRRPRGWLETRFIELNRSDFDIGGETDTSLFLVPGLRWRKAAADDDLYPRRGYRLQLELRGAADALLSDTSFASTRLDGLYIRPLPHAARLLLGARLGATWVDTFSALPPSERFFAGGDRSLRGYEFESLGPVDAEGEVIGGTYLGIVSVEYEYPIFERWSLAAFVDAGNAFGGDGNNDGIKKSVGIGARWRSPVGAVRLDLAHPFDSDDIVMFHLRIGPDL